MALLAGAAFYTTRYNDALAGALFQSSSLTQPTNLQSGLVGWWTFDVRWLREGLVSRCSTTNRGLVRIRDPIMEMLDWVTPPFRASDGIR